MTNEYDIVTNTQPYAEDLGVATENKEPASPEGQGVSVTRNVIPMAQVHIESSKRVANLNSKLTEAISEVYRESQGELTYGEILASLAEKMQAWAKYLRKEELNESQYEDTRSSSTPSG
jgi:hypothetical protein